MNPELVYKNKLNSSTIFSFLNEAIDKFYKTRYSGINVKGEGFEQTQKRINDLRTLVCTKCFSLKDGEIVESNECLYKVSIPSDMVLLLGDTVGIQPTDQSNNCWGKDDTGDYIIKYNDPIESSIETIDRQLNNSLSEHKLKYNTAKPLRLIQNNEICLYTDGNYEIAKYVLKYLKKPDKLSHTDLTSEYTSLPEHTHMEIVKTAVQLYLATKPMEHYSVYSTEVNNME